VVDEPDGGLGLENIIETISLEPYSERSVVFGKNVGVINWSEKDSLATANAGEISLGCNNDIKAEAPASNKSAGL